MGGYFFAMKVTTKNIENYEQELTVEFEWAEVEKTKKKAAKTLAERVTIPGFRKGKAPIQKLEQYYGKGAVLDEAADMLIQKGANDAIKELDIIPVTTMKPKIVTCEEGKDLVFTLTFTPYPEVKLGEYKNLEAEKVVEPVTDEAVNNRLEEMRGHHANMIDAAEGDAIVDGDFITLDFVGTVDGEKFEGGEAKDYPLNIGSKTFIDNFEDQLIGAKVGEEREIKVTFPETYHVKELADRPAIFKCKINSIKHKELPALDDEFAKKTSQFGTLDELKADIRANLQRTAEHQALHDQQDAVIEKAIANMTVDIPPVMIEDRITALIKEFEAQLQMQGLKLENYMMMAGIDMDKLRENYRDSAIRSLQADFLLEAVSKAENIEATNQELNTELAYMAMIYRTTPKQIMKILKDNGQLANVRTNVIHRKARFLIIQNSNAAEHDEEVATDSGVAEATEK